MLRGMIVSCGGCGRLQHVDLSKSAKDIEQQIDHMINAEGWRYTKKWNGWLCRSCQNGGGDALYETFFGKPKAESKMNSYKHLVAEAAMQIEEFNLLEGI